MSIIDKAQWYRHRLASMSAPEMAYRLGEMAKRRRDRKHGDRFVPVRRTEAKLPELPGLKAGLLRWDVPLALLAEWNEHAEQAKSGRYVLLGQEWPGITDGTKWHLDPLTGHSWPAERYCFDIDTRHASAKGDVKYVWELGRLQFLQPVAALACKTGDAELAAFCLGEIESWIDANPPHLGLHWASGIELALRVVSMLVVVTLLGEWIGEPLALKIQGSLEAHGSWLERYPSKYSSANNHRTAEGLGLFLLGALDPGSPSGERWKKEGWNILCDAACCQILPDGAGAEQSPNYTAAVLEMLLLARHVALSIGLVIPDVYRERLTRAGEYLRWLTDEGGSQPQIGDNDNSRILGAYRRDETYVRSILGTLSAVLDEPDLAPPHEMPHLRQALFGFSPRPGAAPEGVRHFEQGGYTIGRQRIGGHAVLLAIDHGPLGYLSIAAHGHADALSVWLHVGDQPVLIDAGTYLYHSGGQWRSHFRSTEAHNTLCMEHTDSSRMAGPFNWSHKAKASVVASGSRPDGWWIEAEHDGYRKKFGAIHRRRLALDTAHGLTIEDRIVADKPHKVAIHYLLHPSLQVRQEGESALILKNDASLLRVTAQGPLVLEILQAGSEEGGWYSPGFGEKWPAPRLRLGGMLAPEVPVSTIFTLA